MSDPDYLIKGWTQGSHDACVVRIRALEHDIAELEASLSSGKASGKTEAPTWHPNDSGRMVVRIMWDIQRIAELEAEVERLRAELSRTRDTWLWETKRAEKAEREIDRLTQEQGVYRELWLEHDPEARRRLREVNPSGDTLGGGGRESESLSARKATPKTGHYHVEFDPNCSACRFAADPAARKERDEG